MAIVKKIQSRQGIWVLFFFLTDNTEILTNQKFKDIQDLEK
jgi:hypothetical protein